MATPQTVKRFLDEKNVSYEILTHPTAFTAQEVAHAIHQTGKVLAKTLIVEHDGKTVMVVVPAHHKVDLKSLKAVLGVKDVHLTLETRLRELFPESDLGAMPPLGPLYNLPVIVSKTLAENPDIVFNACTHTECAKMKYADFEKIVNPKVAEISDIPKEAR